MKRALHYQTLFHAVSSTYPSEADGNLVTLRKQSPFALSPAASRLEGLGYNILMYARKQIEFFFLISFLTDFKINEKSHMKRI